MNSSMASKSFLIDSTSPWNINVNVAYMYITAYIKIRVSMNMQSKYYSINVGGLGNL